VLVLQLVERPARDAGRCGFESRRAHPARDKTDGLVAGLSASLAQLDKRSSPVPRRLPVRARQEAQTPSVHCAFVAPVVERARGKGEGDGSSPSEGST
jgi:hypothetical protein